MQNSQYYGQEELCQLRFEKNAGYYHLNTPENHPLIFAEESDFKVGMGLMGICAMLFPLVKIFTFQLMGNHLHIVASGIMEDIVAMFESFRTFLSRYLKSCGKDCDLSGFKAHVSKIDSLDYLRNAISYVNRNGAVADPNETPFSYKWGANNLFFSTEAKARHGTANMILTQCAVQTLTHSRKCDNVKNLYTVDGYVSPMSFCRIAEAEGFFRDARHYFYSVARNVESYKEIAELIGETMFYTDQDIYLAIGSICKNEYRCDSVNALPPDAKRSIAQKLHYDYHCSNKQIQRSLKLSLAAVDQMFPMSATK